MTLSADEMVEDVKCSNSLAQLSEEG